MDKTQSPGKKPGNLLTCMFLQQYILSLHATLINLYLTVLSYSVS